MRARASHSTSHLLRASSPRGAARHERWRAPALGARQPAASRGPARLKTIQRTQAASPFRAAARTRRPVSLDTTDTSSLPSLSTLLSLSFHAPPCPPLASARPTNHPSIDTSAPSTCLSLGIARGQREPVLRASIATARILGKQDKLARNCNTGASRAASLRVSSEWKVRNSSQNSVLLL